MNAPYGIQFCDPADRTSLEALYRAVYGEAWREKTCLDWYLGQPLAEAGAAIAVMDDRIVAAQPFCDLPLHTPWGATRMTLFLDVATHPAHRRRGLFRRVVTAARQGAFERGAAIILTTPNRTAFQGFQTLSEWRHFCSLDCLVLPLGAGKGSNERRLVSLGVNAVSATVSLLWRGALERARLSAQAGYDIKSPWVPGIDADELWDCVAANAGITVMRNRAFLQWRFGSNYRLFSSNDKHGLVGYAAARVITRGGIRIGMVLDCVTSNNGASAQPLLASVLTWFRERGAVAAMGYFLRESAPWRQARATGFLPLARPFVPRAYPVCASVRPDHPHNVDLLNPSYWYMSLADSDLV